MYQLTDTIIAVSSPGSAQRTIIRITGPETIAQLNRIFTPAVSKTNRGIIAGSVSIDDELKADATLYLFAAPNSYTGESVAEIHIYTNSAVTETLMAYLLKKGLRAAGPGEFTARAYLNGKIDLAQAEAVNEIIVTSNKLQLDAAEKLLSGRLSEKTEKIRTEIMDTVSLIEAGLDFSGEDIQFISCQEGLERLTKIKNELQDLLSSSISYEALIDLPAVAIAGAPNAGKSRLLNKLLGEPRSIVSQRRKTTRDVLSGQLTLAHCRCVLFDCAGLIQSAHNILDELTQRAAIEAIRNSTAVIFCIDISKTKHIEDAAIGTVIEQSLKAPNSSSTIAQRLIPAATKCDLVSKELLADRLAQLKELFGVDFLATSAKTGAGTETLLQKIDNKIIALSVGSVQEAFSEVAEKPLAITARHRQTVSEAIEQLSEAARELKAGNDEIAAMMLRSAYQVISTIEQQSIDDKILETIFSRFCIGK
jgi:tRNA modification GTPase